MIWLLIFSLLTLLVKSLNVEGEVNIYPQCPSGETCTGFACTVVLNGGAQTEDFDGLVNFSFDGLQTGDTYTITVQDAVYSTADGIRPLVCTVNNCCGTMGTEDVTDVVVTCSTNGYTFSGAVISARNSPTLQLNGHETVSVSINEVTGIGAFSFAPVAFGSNYEITVLQQPPGEYCTVIQNPSGVVTDDTALNNVLVSCTTAVCYTLTGELVADMSTLNDGNLENECPWGSMDQCDFTVQMFNQGSNFGTALTSVGAFSTEVCQGQDLVLTASGYEATLDFIMKCLVYHGQHSNVNSDISGVRVECARRSYKLGGTITGSRVGSIKLTANWGEVLYVGTDQTEFQFTSDLPANTDYDITMEPLMAGDSQCTMTGSAGISYEADVDLIVINCGRAPSKNPVTSRPSVQPQAEPTPSPTESPTDPDPTPQPTTSPTDSPTIRPTEEFPSVSPTIDLGPIPSVAPTQDCSNFFVGYCPCEEESELDIVFLLDSSDSISDEDFFNFKNIVASGIQSTFPNEGPRLGVIQFSSTVETVVEFDNGQTPAQWAQEIRGMEHLKAATYTRRAFETAWDTMWQNNLDPTRRAVTIVVTDGEPQPSSQIPCQQVLNYFQAGIEIIGVAVGVPEEDLALDPERCAEFGVDFPPEAFIPVISIETYNQANQVAGGIFSLISSCGGGLTITPYNGGYSTVVGQEFNGKPVYINSEGWLARWEFEGWSFIDPSGNRQPMFQFPGTNTPWPKDLSDWTWEASAGYYVDYQDVVICCVDTVIPTRYPSNNPTIRPTGGPSKNPSKFPTGPPSFLPSHNPSFDPTIQPSHNPSTVPTLAPSYTPPSVSPSVSPSFNPSTIPSANPTWSFHTVFIELVLVEEIGGSSLTQYCVLECTPLVDVENDGTRMRLTGQNTFGWPVEIQRGSTYDFTVHDPLFVDNPGIPLDCTIENGQGVMPNGNVDNIVITCVPGTYNVGGVVEDAQGEITLGLNGVTDDDAYITSVVGYGINDNRVDFHFDGDIISGTFYQVTVVQNPPGQGCTVINGVGVSTVDIDNVIVRCIITDQPSRTPSRTPSEAPVAAPSFNPSFTPTGFPSMKPTIFESKSPSTTPTLAPSDRPCPCLSNDPLSIGMDSIQIISDQTSFVNDVLTLCFEVPEYYDISKMYLEAEEPNLGAGYPNPEYWSYESNNITCRATLCMEYSWQDLITFGDLTLVERRDDLYYQGIVDITINDCYPDIDRKICWQYPFALLLDRTVTVCLSDEATATDDDCDATQQAIAATCINYGLLGAAGQQPCEDDPNCNWISEGCDYDGTSQTMYCMPKVDCEVNGIVSGVDLIFNEDGECGTDDDCSEEEEQIARECINHGLTGSVENQNNCESNPNCVWRSTGCDYTTDGDDSMTLYCMPTGLTCEVEEILTGLDIRFADDGSCGDEDNDDDDPDNDDCSLTEQQIAAECIANGLSNDEYSQFQCESNPNCEWIGASGCEYDGTSLFCMPKIECEVNGIYDGLDLIFHPDGSCGSDDDCSEEDKAIAQECVNLGLVASSANAQTCEDHPNCNWVDNGCEYDKENGDQITLYCMPRDIECEVEEVVTDLDIRFNPDGTCGDEDNDDDPDGGCTDCDTGDDDDDDGDGDGENDCSVVEVYIATKCLTTDSDSDCSANPNCNYNPDGCTYTQEDGTQTSVYCAPILTCEVDNAVGTVDLVFNAEGTCPDEGEEDGGDEDGPGITISGGDPKFNKAYVVKLGQYLPQPYSTQVKVIVESYTQNPWRVADTGIKIRPSEDLINDGLYATMVDAIVIDQENCDYDLTEEYCVQHIDVTWDMNSMCHISGIYYLDIMLQASGNENSNVPLTLQLELGLDPSCPTTLGSLPLAGNLVSYANPERTVLEQAFDINEKAYFSLTIGSVRRITASQVTQIQIKQAGVDNIIYLKGQAVGWGSDPAFGFSLDDSSSNEVKDFEFLLNPDYINSLLTGAELVICVDAEVQFAGAVRSVRLRMLVETDDDLANLKGVYVEQPIFITGDRHIDEAQINQEIILAPEIQNSSGKNEENSSISYFLLITLMAAMVISCSIFAYCIYQHVYKEDVSQFNKKNTYTIQSHVKPKKINVRPKQNQI